MSTRSFIIIANPKGDFVGSYCHWDGYPSNNGRILLEHYSVKSKARALVQLGSLSSISERVKPLNPATHSYDFREEGTTVAYHRDRAEPWDAVKPFKADTLRAVIENAESNWVEYVYLFWRGHWSYNTIDDAAAGKPFHTLTTENTKEPAL